MKRFAVQKSILTTLLVCAPSAVLVTRRAHAQIANGSITGRVTDGSGAIVPNADVTLTKTETGIVTTSKANGDGIFNFPSLQTGTYRVSVALSGFSKTESQIVLAVGQTAQLDLTLQVGGNTETVNVQAGTAEQLNTDNSTLSYTVGARQVNELSLNGRNPYALAQVESRYQSGRQLQTRFRRPHFPSPAAHSMWMPTAMPLDSGRHTTRWGRVSGSRSTRIR